MYLENLKVPTLVVNKERCRENIEMMYSKAQKSGVAFRPHFKTHQSAEVGQIYKEYGINSITVSSIRMAAYFAENGFNDITIAVPINIHEHELLNQTAQKAQVNILVEDTTTIPYLDKRITHPIGAFIKIDGGYHRTGILPNAINTITQVIETLEKAQKISFKGFLTHAGHTYKAQHPEEIKERHKQGNKILGQLGQKYQKDYPNLILSAGDTPGCSLTEKFTEIHEIRPGNFIYYDLTMETMGVCRENQIAAIAACPVVAKHPERNEIIIYGGGVHLSKEGLNLGDKTSFGKVVSLTPESWGTSWEESYISSLSQEHGIIKTTPEKTKEIQVGDFVGILPVHSCMTANALRGGIFTDGTPLTMMKWR